MPEQEKGQAEAQPAKPTYDELYAKGWETVEAEEAKPKEPEKTPMEKLKEEPECPDCPGGKFYKVIKHNGKDVGIKTEKEYNDYVQMGFDYTKKTQALAEERKRLEAEKSKVPQELLDRLDRLERERTAAKPGGDGKEESPAPVDPSKIYEEFGLDEEFASDFDKKVIDTIVKLREENQSIRQISQLMVVKEITNAISGALSDAVKEFGIEDVTNDSGESLTGQQVISAFKEIIKDPANAKTPVAKLAREAVKRVHEAQTGAKATVETIDDESTSEEDFSKKYPKLYAKIKKAGGREAAADFTEETKDLPPTIEPRKGDVAPAEAAAKDKPKFKSLAEAIDAGLDDKDIISPLFGG